MKIKYKTLRKALEKKQQRPNGQFAAAKHKPVIGSNQDHEYDFK